MKCQQKSDQMEKNRIPSRLKPNLDLNPRKMRSELRDSRNKAILLFSGVTCIIRLVYMQTKKLNSNCSLDEKKKIFFFIRISRGDCPTRRLAKETNLAYFADQTPSTEKFILLAYFSDWWRLLSKNFVTKFASMLAVYAKFCFSIFMCSNWLWEKKN